MFFVVATVDTTAQVTIVSDEVYMTWKPMSIVMKKTTLHPAGRRMVIMAFVVGPVYREN